MTKNFNELPKDVQEKIKDRLRAFRQVDVYFEYGEYHFGLVIKKTYGDDHEVIGTYYDTDIFTDEERILNYVNEFQDYPIEYKGKRNYKIFHTGKRETFEMVNGEIVIAK